MQYCQKKCKLIAYYCAIFDFSAHRHILLCSSTTLPESTTGRALMPSLHQPSPRTGAAAAPVSLTGRGLVLSQRSARLSDDSLRLSSSLLTCTNRSEVARLQLLQSTEASLRHSHSEGHHVRSIGTPRKVIANTADALAKAQSRIARKLNDSMVYIDGPQIYTCAQCRTHLTSHDEIISKSFHGRHGESDSRNRLCSMNTISTQRFFVLEAAHIFLTTVSMSASVPRKIDVS